VRVIGAGLRLGVSVVAGGVCAVGVAALGGEGVAESAAAGCSEGANKAMDYIGSRLGIDAADAQTSDITKGYGQKARVRAAASIARKVKISAKMPKSKV